jgi:hypothetical protein
MKDKFKKIEMTFYRNNVWGYYLILLVIIGNLYTTVSVLNMITTDWKIGVSVIFNIILTLVLFLCAIKIKVYKSEWVWFNFGLAAYALIRNFLILPHFYLLESGKTVAVRIVNYLTVASLLLASFITLKKVKDQAFFRKHRQGREVRNG